MPLRARAIDRDHLRRLFRLKVRPGQEQLVAPNEITLAQAAYEPFSTVWSLWDEDILIGLMAMVDLRPEHPDFHQDDPENALYLWRLLIGADHQRKGYGAQAVQLAYKHARDLGRTTMCVHVGQAEGHALDFYRGFGLKPTGRVDDGELFLTGPVD